MGYISRSAKYQVPCVHVAYTMGEMRCINQLCLGCHFHPQYSYQIINSDLHTLLIVRRCVCVCVWWRPVSAFTHITLQILYAH